ncbi:asparagine synthase (glutamine-hydrolyzing) [Gemmiger formicilis]|uniref:asparagine synthase (glutamine-hydrolyzing) n=1 Tax=Gemmiger formicilis TaxID=745368 RepID=UPI003A8EBE73
MCGIVGFTTAAGHDPAAAKRTAQAMADLIRHRGPDGEGYYADAHAALGHRRLSIIDLAGGGQPMFNEDGTLVVVFNGEIYNYKALHAELTARGHTFATDSDTEVLLHGYEAWGGDLPKHLRGMFAFALWDRTAETLFCARDLFGIKPLYYYKKGDVLLFASEIKAFLAHPAFEKRLNEARLPDWLSMEYLPDDETMFLGVYELPPAHTLTWHDGRLTTRRYAAPRFRARRGRSLGAWAEKIGQTLAESADAHRIADVAVGCFLSGGVDSSLVTRETARSQPNVQCFSVGYAEESYSELPAARAAARALGVPLTETTVTAAEFFAANRAIQWYLDEPMPNPAEVPLYFLCKTARQRVKVVLSGEGADELFGGYPLYRQAVWAERWQALPHSLRRGLAAALPGCGFLRRGAQPRWQRCARANYVFETAQERDKYLKRPSNTPSPARRCKPYFDAVRGLDEPTALQWVDLQTWLPRDILRKADRMSMAHSLELRVPFLDRRVLAVALGLPRRYRCTGRRGKIALRATAARRLPGALAANPKRGFPVPLADWLCQDEYYKRVRTKFTGPVAERFFDTAALCALLDAHRAGKTNAMTKLWAFYCFIEWYEVYFVEEFPPIL